MNFQIGRKAMKNQMPIVNQTFYLSNFLKKSIMKTFSIFSIVFSIAVLSSTQLYSQLNLGVNFSKVYSQAKPHGRVLASQGKIRHDLSFLSEETTKSFGLSLYKSFTKLYFNTDISYRESVSQYMVKDYWEEALSNDGSYVTQNTKRIQMPVHAGINYKNFKIGTGVIFNYMIDNDKPLEQFDNFSYTKRNLDTGMILFLGYKLFNKVLIHARYEKDFTNVGSHIFYERQSTRIKSCMDNISIGITLYPLGMD